MKNLILTVTICFLLFFGDSVKAQTQENFQEGSCSSLGRYLQNCEKFKCIMANPKNEFENIEQEIIGFTENGYCLHKQIMPNNVIIKCKYSEESRKYISLRMEQSKTANYTDQEQVVLEKRLMQDIFQHECEISGNDKNI